MGKQVSIALPSIASSDRLTQHHHTVARANGSSGWSGEQREAASQFAHPAEFDLARILSFYHVRWVYEPTSFQLQHDEYGRPTEQVTPDFYLPEYDLYVELTTMRQRLVTRKNRKIRLLKEKHPSVDVKLLYKRDYERLIGTFPLPDVRNHRYEIDDVLIGETEIQERIEFLGQELATLATGDKPSKRRRPLLLGLGQNSRMFLRQLVDTLDKMGTSIQDDWMSFSSYGNGADERKVRIGRRPAESIDGRDIIVAVDVVSTGLSLAYLTKWLHRKGASSVRICTLLDRRDARIVDIPVELSGFCAPIELLAGFGISVARQFADLPGIAVVQRSMPPA